MALPYVSIVKTGFLFGGGGGPPSPIPVGPQPLTAVYADNNPSIGRGSVQADGIAVTSWGGFSTLSGTPLLIADSVTGRPAIRVKTGAVLSMPAGSGACLSNGASTVLMVRRVRKYNFGGAYSDIDTTEGGTTAGYQLQILDSNPDIFSARLFQARIYDGASYILDTNTSERWGSFIPLKWEVVAVRVSNARWETRVDGRPTYFLEQTVSFAYPASIAGRLLFGGGPSDYMCLEIYNSYLSDSDLADAEARLAARFGLSNDMLIPIAGLIDWNHLTTPNYFAFPWATALGGGVIDVTIFAAHDETPQDANHIIEVKSSDGGVTYSAAATIYQSDAATRYADPHTLIMSNGHVLRNVYTYDAGSIGKKIWQQVSTDGGATYSALVDITLGSSYQVQLGGSPVEDPDNAGNIFFASYEQGSISDTWLSLYLYKSTDFGATWARTLLLDGNAGGINRQYTEAQLLFHTSGDLRCLIRDTTSGAAGMRMTRSTNKGAAWAAATGILIAANSAGQSYVEIDGVEYWLGRPNTTQTLALYTRAAGALWNDAWPDIPNALYIDPRYAEMVYGGILRKSAGILYIVWGAFTGNAPTTPGDVSAWANFYTWYTTHAMPGTVSPTAANLTVSTTQQLAVTGAGDFTYNVTGASGGTCVAGLYTAGVSNGVDVVTVSDLNGKTVGTFSATVTGASVSVVVTSIFPDVGLEGGGTSVTITGSGFSGASGATVGGAALTSFVVVNGTTITGVTGVHAIGNVNVTVTNGSTGTLNNGYTYLPTGATLLLTGGVGLTLSGSDVQVWADQSGHGNNAAPLSFSPTAVTGMNGKPVVRFVNAEALDFASFTGGLTAADVFILAQNADDTSTAAVMAFTDDTQQNFTPLGGSRLCYDGCASTTRQTTGFAPPAGGWSSPWLIEELGTSSEWTFSFNGTQQYTQASNTFGYGTRHIGKGVGNDYLGDIGAIWIWPRKLSTPERSVVVVYLKARGGIA